jgi:hypothetical protein
MWTAKQIAGKSIERGRHYQVDGAAEAWWAVVLAGTLTVSDMAA